MDYELLTEYIRPELMVLVVVLYFIGMALKKTTYVKDELIPVTLGLISILLCAIYILAVEPISGGYQQVLIAVFNIIIQGLCCAAAAVFFNQLYKQNSKLNESKNVEETEDSL